MEIIRTVSEMQEYAKTKKKAGKSIGFVPTMGYLHEGHERLIKQARQENDIIITSIFVNPLQFGPNEDFDHYPRDEEHDKLVCQQYDVDVLFLPEVTDMYPSEPEIKVEVLNRSSVLCGRSRQGHFDGVVTVLAKLFNITLPDTAYFGMKDAQQIAIVDALVKNFNYPIKLVPVKTVREPDDLAKSSRNVYLSESEREQAKYIYQALEHGRNLVIDGEKNPAIIIKEVENFILQQTRGKIDYVELLNFPELTPTDLNSNQIILACAVQFDKARLIDNLVFNKNGIITERIL